MNRRATTAAAAAIPKPTTKIAVLLLIQPNRAVAADSSQSLGRLRIRKHFFCGQGQTCELAALRRENCASLACLQRRPSAISSSHALRSAIRRRRNALKKVRARTEVKSPPVDRPKARISRRRS
jgi:hypothetical protein